MIDQLAYEKEAYQKGYNYIAGVDEVGRGPMAGPVVAACVIMPKDQMIEGINDSKKISDKMRRKLYNEIKEKALAVGVCFLSHKVVDEINIYQASKLAMERAIKKLKIKPDYVLTDAMKLDIDIPHQPIIKGDMLSYTIGCASIVAKVARDDYMIRQAKKYPGYDFENNKGYPTKKHKEALIKLGVLPIHRITYQPVADELNKLKEGAL